MSSSDTLAAKRKLDFVSTDFSHPLPGFCALCGAIFHVLEPLGDTFALFDPDEPANLNLFQLYLDPVFQLLVASTSPSLRFMARPSPEFPRAIISHEVADQQAHTRQASPRLKSSRAFHKNSGLTDRLNRRLKVRGNEIKAAPMASAPY